MEPKTVEMIHNLRTSEIAIARVISDLKWPLYGLALTQLALTGLLIYYFTGISLVCFTAALCIAGTNIFLMFVIWLVAPITEDEVLAPVEEETERPAWLE